MEGRFIRTQWDFSIETPNEADVECFYDVDTLTKLSPKEASNLIVSHLSCGISQKICSLIYNVFGEIV